MLSGPAWLTFLEIATISSMWLCSSSESINNRIISNRIDENTNTNNRGKITIANNIVVKMAAVVVEVQARREEHQQRLKKVQ